MADPLDDFYDNLKNPFISVLKPDVKAPAQGAARYSNLFLKGATLGALGRDVQAESIPEHLTEFAGSVLPIGAATGGVGSVIGATRAGAALARLSPLISRLATATGTGALYGGAKEAISGEKPDLSSIGKAAGEEAAWWLAGEGAFVGLGRLWRGAPLSKAQAAKQAEAIAAVKEGRAPESISDYTGKVITDASQELGEWRLPLTMDDPVSLAKPGPKIAEYGPDISRWHETSHYGETEKLPRYFESGHRLDEGDVYALVDNTPKRKTIDNFATEGTPKEIEDAISSGAPVKDFIKSTDSATNIETLVSTNSTTDAVIDAATKSPRITGLQFTPEQAQKVIDPTMAVRLEEPLIAKEAANTTKMIETMSTMSNDEAAKFLESKVPAPMGKTIVLAPSVEDIKIRELMKKIGMSDDEIGTLSKELDGHINGVRKEIETAGGKWDASVERSRKLDYLRETLRKRCL